MAKDAKGRSWFSMKALAGGSSAEIAIYSDIGDWGVTAADFAASLAALGDVQTLNVRIMSNGGEVSQGFAIYNMLDRHTARKVVTIDGLAASMASVIAMVGDEVEMPSNALMMIHNPYGGVAGDANNVASFADALQKMQDQIADTYVRRSGADRAEIVALMNRETWLTAQEAVALGLADRISDAVEMRAAVDISKFSKAPAAFGQRMKEMTMKAKTGKNAARAAEQDTESDTEADASNSLKAADEIREEVKAQNKEIRSICALAGKAELADGFIDNDLSPSDVVAELDKQREKEAKDKSKNVSGRNNPNDARESVKSLDPVSAYKNWNGAGKK